MSLATLLVSLMPKASGLLAAVAFWPIPYNTRLVLSGTMLLGFAGGLIGALALLRRRSLASDAASHATLPGVVLMAALVTSLGGSVSLPLLMVGAAITALLGLLSVQGIVRWTRIREDAAIAIVLSVSYAFGIVLLSALQRESPTEATALNHFLYGQAAALTIQDAQVLAVAAALSLLFALSLSKEFALVAFDPAFAAAAGWPVARLDALLFALIVLVTVAGLPAVGLLLVVAILVIPPVTARFWTDRVFPLLLLSGVLGALAAMVGTLWSAAAPERPAGAVIVLSAGVIFLFSFLVAPSRGLLASGLRRLRQRMRLASDHVLEAATERESEAGLRLAELSVLARWSRAAFFWRPILVFALKRGGYVQRSKQGLALTDRGLARGLQVRRNHVLWEAYLQTHGDLGPAEVDWMVDCIEHVLSADLVQSLERDLEGRGVKIPAGVLSGERAG